MCYAKLPPLIVIATRNAGKLREFQQLFQALPTTVIGLDQFPHVSVSEEPYDTYQDNAAHKANHVMTQLNLPVLADDSGLEIEALPDLLGVYSARYQPELSYLRKCDTILTLLENKPRYARFVAALALVIPEGQSFVVEGECRGVIAPQLKGEHGFGYDPIFIPKGYTTTYAEMSDTIKNTISHRAQAVKLLLIALGEHDQ